ncbi:secondary thiamine-phosphate synthase enzyme YjbQ [Egicoccus sp. AB-alg6-2]|uniref:secondary thiamine-phosphate synthase enzyme YjbQ n=1 Tax=Egicoccus sp. AB-alg6-2 TaxID=3242692 RepID=UPI00359E5AEA
MHTRRHTLRTGDRRITDVTDLCAAFVAEIGTDGLLHVFLPHATAGLALLETGAGSDTDLADHLDALLPRDDRWRHAHGAPGHGADHVLPALISPSLVVPVDAGRLALGTWQSIVVVDTNPDNPERTLRLSLLAG